MIFVFITVCCETLHFYGRLILFVTLLTTLCIICISLDFILI